MGRKACTEPQCLYKGDLYLLTDTGVDLPYILLHCMHLSLKTCCLLLNFSTIFLRLKIKVVDVSETHFSAILLSDMPLKYKVLYPVLLIIPASLSRHVCRLCRNAEKGYWLRHLCLYNSVPTERIFTKFAI
jgi:hypothetical protein